MPNYELGACAIMVKDMDTVVDTTISGTAGITDADTTIPVTAVDAFPDTGIVKIEDEYILYLEKDDDTDDLKQCVRGIFGTTAAVHAGATDVVYYASGLGKTFGGVNLVINETSIDLKTDQDGETPVDSRISGTTVEITINLADISLENFALGFKQAITGMSPNRRVAVKPNVGYSTQTNASMIHIFPYSGGTSTIDTNVEHQYTMPSAGIIAATELPFDAATQRAIKVVFKGFPDSANEVLICGKPF
jgi:hypothetical protein